MNDNELDQLLDHWRTPEPSPGLRRRVLAHVSAGETRRFGRPLRWGLTIAAASGMLAIGMQQSGRPALEGVAQGIHDLHDSMFFWLDQHWSGHVLGMFGSANVTVYVDGVAVPDAEVGTSGATIWVRLPGERRYAMALRRPEGSMAARVGRFHGHNLAFQAGGRSIRIESGHSAPFGMDRGVYLMEPAAER